jgi:PmbA protein
MTDCELLTRAECQALFEHTQTLARELGTEDVEVTLEAHESALTRFANNTIHQNMAERRRHLSVRTVLGCQTARAGTNCLDAASLRQTVERAVAMTRAATPDPDLPEMAGPSEAPEVERYFPATAQTTPRERADMVAEAVGIVGGASQLAAGICSTGQAVIAVLNSRGVFSYYCDTLAQFSVTAMDADSSGWAKGSAPDIREISPLALSRRASEKASLSAAPRELPPGRYTVILEPSAVQDLTCQLFADFSATAVADQRSFLTGRLGTPLVGRGVHITDDVYHPLQAGAPFDGEGMPRKRLTLIDAGTPRALACSRQTARRTGSEPTGHGFPMPSELGEAPINIVFEGGDQTVTRMVESTQRGILVTRLWYIREVDPYQKIMTGMTRDGTFLIEKGELVGGVRNFRFNQNLIELLSNVEALSPAERSSGEESFDMVVPALKVHDFHFTEVTQF